MTPTLIERAAAILESRARLEFLANLGFNVALASRDCYPSARERGTIDPATCGLNEAAMLIFQELLHDADPSDERPSARDWLGDAQIKAEHYGAQKLFQSALSRAVQRLS
jgi:hypothetical protein